MHANARVATPSLARSLTGSRTLSREVAILCHKLCATLLPWLPTLTWHLALMKASSRNFVSKCTAGMTRARSAAGWLRQRMPAHHDRSLLCDTVHGVAQFIQLSPSLSLSHSVSLPFPLSLSLFLPPSLPLNLNPSPLCTSFVGCANVTEFACRRRSLSQSVTQLSSRRRGISRNRS